MFRDFFILIFIISIYYYFFHHLLPQIRLESNNIFTVFLYKTVFSLARLSSKAILVLMVNTKQRVVKGQILNFYVFSVNIAKRKLIDFIG